MSQACRCPDCQGSIHEADHHCIHCGLRLNVAGYQVTKRLGAGGMGEVFLGFHPALNRKVAIKFVSPDMQESQAFRQRFLREARIMASLDHENIVRLHHFDELDGQLFLITELVEGVTLKTPAGSVKVVSLEDLLVARLEHREGPVSVEFAVDLLRGMLEALEYAHSAANPIVHRDIKPANILLTPFGQPKLADFGISKFGGETTSGLTATGIAMGTEDYMAPEQFYSHLGTVSERSDLYSLGLTVYLALAGVSPEGLRGRLAGHLPDVREHNSAVPKGLAVVLARALQFKPQDRYGSAREMRSSLELATMGEVSREHLNSPDAEPRGRKGLKLGLGVGVGLLAMVIAGYSLVQMDSQRGESVPPSPVAGSGEQAKDDERTELAVEERTSKQRDNERDESNEKPEGNNKPENETRPVDIQIQPEVSEDEPAADISSGTVAEARGEFVVAIVPESPPHDRVGELPEDAKGRKKKDKTKRRKVNHGLCEPEGLSDEKDREDVAKVRKLVEDGMYALDAKRPNATKAAASYGEAKKALGSASKKVEFRCRGNVRRLRNNIARYYLHLTKMASNYAAKPKNKKKREKYCYAARARAKDARHFKADERDIKEALGSCKENGF